MATAKFTTSASTGTIEDFDEMELANKGVELMLNNEWDEAMKLFMKYKDQSAIMYAGAGWVHLFQSMISFEEDEIKKAMKLLQDLEKKCSAKNNVFKSLVKKIKNRKKSKDAITIEYKLQCKVIVADSILHQAILTFLKQDLSSYIKGGWLIRKAYNIYEKLYREIKKMHEQSLKNQKGGVSKISQDIFSTPADPEIPANDVTAEYHVTNPETNQNPAKSENEAGDADEAVEMVEEMGMEALDVQDDNETNAMQDRNEDKLNTFESNTENFSNDNDGSSGVVLSHEAIERLLGSVSLGYGAFQLTISLIPSKILKVIQFLGFEGDRAIGLEALKFTSDSKDMRAPLASLGLIWYHTVIRPFFALDGSSVDAGVSEANVIIARCEKIYPKSGLFLFFKGRAQRLECKLDTSLETYKQAYEFCKGQREMEMICCHEMGWIHMMKLDMSGAMPGFERLKTDSRWSKSYYAYLLMLLHGGAEQYDTARKQLKDVTDLSTHKNNQIEQYALKRAEKFRGSVALTRENCTLYLIEVVYLWNAITQCPPKYVDSMIDACNKVTDKNLFHLKCLLEGALYRQKGDHELSTQCFEEAVARRDGMKDDAYVSAYALYELGITQLVMTQTYEEGRKNLLKARDGFKEYDFDNRLSVRINAALRRMTSDGTPL